jgi:hypothetical protein
MHVSVSGGTGSELREAVRLIQNSDFSLRITDRLRMWWFDKDGLPDWLVIEPEQMSVHFTDERPANGDLVGELSDIVDHGIDGTISVLSYINDGDSTFEILADGQVRVKRPINTGETLDLERLKALSRAAEVRSQVEQ